MPGNANVAEPGLVVVTPGSARDHDLAGLGLPPRVDDRRLVAADVLAVPHPGFRVDRLADRAEDAQGRQVVRRRQLHALLHERADGGRGAVQDRDLVVLDDLPPAVPGRGVRGALVQDPGRRVGERAVDDVAVAGHPADVGGAPVHVVGLDVEDRVVAERRPDAGSRRSCAGCPWAWRSCPTCRAGRACAPTRPGPAGSPRTGGRRCRATRCRDPAVMWTSWPSPLDDDRGLDRRRRGEGLVGMVLERRPPCRAGSRRRR